MEISDWRYLWLDDVGVPHTQPIVSWHMNPTARRLGEKLPRLLLAKGTPVDGGSATAALVASDGHCWAWNLDDDGEWSTVDQAITALRKRSKRGRPALTLKSKQEPEPEPESENEPETETEPAE